MMILLCRGIFGTIQPFQYIEERGPESAEVISRNKNKKTLFRVIWRIDLVLSQNKGTQKLQQQQAKTLWRQGVSTEPPLLP